MRSSWKLPYISTIFFKKYYNKKNQFITHIRNSLIPLSFVNKKILVYNGKNYINISIINADCICFKLGEFILTKTFRKFRHLKKRKKKIKKNK